MFLEGLFIMALGLNMTLAPNIQKFDLSSIKEQYVEYNPVIFYEPPKWTYSNCVEFAKWKLGKQGTSWGWASKVVPDGSKPAPGVILLTNEGLGHMAVITSVSGDFMAVDEANYYPGRRSQREIRLDSPVIRGYKTY